MNRQAATVAAASDLPSAASRRAHRRRTGSLTRRMIGVAALWIAALLLIGGFALDRVLSRSIIDSFDNQLVFVLNSMVASSEIGPDGEVRFNRPPADQRFVEPYSGLYFQISGAGADTFPSRSLWDRRLRDVTAHRDVKPHLYDSNEFSTADHNEPLAHRRTRRAAPRIERLVALPGRAIARDARPANPPLPFDPLLEFPCTRNWVARPCNTSDLLRPLAASAGEAARSPPSARAKRPGSAGISPPRSGR